MDSWLNLAKELRRSILSDVADSDFGWNLRHTLAPFASQSQAAAVAVIYALFVELVINRELKLTKHSKCLPIPE